MAESQGWWYDRRKKRFIKINDHARDAADHMDRYRIKTMTPLETACIAYSLYADMRDTIIKGVCNNGFIRVRLIKGHSTNTLGWQFIGVPHDAFAVLKRFAKRHGVGPLVEVTFTDFGLGRNLTTFWKDFDPEKPPLKTFLDHWEEIHWPPKQWSERTKKDLRAHNGKDLEEILNKEMRRAGR